MQRPNRDRALARSVCAVVVAAAAASGCGPSPTPRPSSSSSSSPASLGRSDGDARSAAVAAAQALRRRALELLLLPLLDDDDPTRWALPSDFPCADEASTTVDGAPVDGRTRLPPTFTVQRRFDGCRLFADARLELAGSVTMQVAFDAAHGLSAVVQPDDLRVRGPGGVDIPVGGRFTAAEPAALPPLAIVEVDAGGPR